jgi:UDP-N-acetylmuramate--alanine ligase
MAGKHVASTDFRNEHWHFIGILGTGMRALANYACERGAHITGSDIHSSPFLKELTQQGIQIRLDQSHGGFDPDTNRVIISQAIDAENPELMRAQEMGVEVVKYPQLLGELMDNQPGIAVAGSHGKSTTSAMIAFLMQKAGLDPSYLIGADVPQLNGGSHCGTGDYLVAEACEYKRSFLYLKPKIGVITNIDREHLDYYYDINDLKDAFREFAAQIDEDGLLVINGDDPNSKCIEDAAKCRIVRYSLEDRKADFHVKKLWRAKVRTNFNLVHKGRDVGRFSLQLYGTHNVYNCLAALAVCHHAGIDLKEAAELAGDFRGAARRLQLLGESWDIAVLSDYAHHPREIKASIAATKQRFPNRRIFCVFQPHQYSRTRSMLPELAEALGEAWLTFVTDIYAARDSEQDRQSVKPTDLVNLMNKDGGMHAHYVPDFNDLEDIVTREVVPQDVVLVMGAGNIWQVARNIVPKIEQKGHRQFRAA